jgi:hypothetical protein
MGLVLMANGEVCKYNLKAVRAYLLKEDFNGILGIRLTSVGREIPGPLAHSGHAFKDRTDEESRKNHTCS